jgi:hypothetical protein
MEATLPVTVCVSVLTAAALMAVVMLSREEEAWGLDAVLEFVARRVLFPFAGGSMLLGLFCCVCV